MTLPKLVVVQSNVMGFYDVPWDMSLPGLEITIDALKIAVFGR